MALQSPAAQAGVVLPYCGAPPLPGTLWGRWNADGVLIATLLALAAAYAVGICLLRRRGWPLSRGAPLAFAAGWMIAAAALISPLCALSVSLFAARVAQHMILSLIAAPLVAVGLPSLARGRGSSSAAFPAAGLFAALIWFWHAPAPYALTFASTTAYWAMHVSVISAAVWLWRTLLATGAHRVLPAVGAGVLSCVQMGLLGALITFAPRPLYAPHALTTAVWGLSPLADQQLGGAIMWAPGGLVFLAAAMFGLARLLAGGGTHDGSARPVLSA